MECSIYKITNPKNKIYIGCTINFKRRLSEYKRLSIKGQTKLYNSLKKYGFDNHIFEIIEECLEDQLNEKEIYWINFYNSVKKGLNIRIGNRNGSLSKETKQKISKALKGRKITWISKGPKGQKLNHGDKISKSLIEYYKNHSSYERVKKFDNNIINEIREKYNTNNFTKSELSKEYNVSWGTIKNIINKSNYYKD